MRPIDQIVRLFTQSVTPTSWKGDGSGRYYQCPFCHGRNKLEICTHRPQWYCHKCGIGGTLDERRRFSTASGVVEGISLEQEPFDPEVFTPMTDRKSPGFRYLRQVRKLSRAICNDLRPHRGPSPIRVYFPFYSFGTTRPCYFVGRAILPGFPRWWNPPAVAKGERLWGLHRLQEPSPQLVICEGVLSACHFPNAVAILGKRMNDWQVDQAIRLCTEELVICLDGDAHKEAMMLAGALADRTSLKVSVIRLPMGLDPDDVRDQLGQFLKQRERIV